MGNTCGFDLVIKLIQLWYVQNKDHCEQFLVVLSVLFLARVAHLKAHLHKIIACPQIRVRDSTQSHYTDVLHSSVQSLTASMSLASWLSSTSRKTSVSVSHETGFLPLPLIHSSSISTLICSASPRCLCSMLRTLALLVSSRRRMPNWEYLVLISWGMLILLSLPRNLTSSIRVGCPPVNSTSWYWLFARLDTITQHPN